MPIEGRHFLDCRGEYPLDKQLQETYFRYQVYEEFLFLQNQNDLPKTQAARPEPPEPHDDMKFNTTPNILTLIRIAFVPIVVGMLFVRDPFWDVVAGFTFTAAALTDFADGYIARTQKIETVYGRLLDPLADKFLVVSSLVMLQELGRIHPVVVMLLICRELAITGLRALASAEGLIIGAGQGGKWKTMTQMFAIPFIMGQNLWGIPIGPLGQVLLYISLALSLWSAKDYIVDFFRAIRIKRKERANAKKAAREARKLAREARRAAKAAKRPRTT